MADKVKEVFPDHEGTEVAGWEELGNEVPRPEEVHLAQLKEGLITAEEGEEMAEERRHSFGNTYMEPKELIAEEYRDGLGDIRFAQESYEGQRYEHFKLGGWIHWYQDRGGDVNYPHCPDCDVKMTAPLLEFRGQKTDWVAGYEGDATAFVTLCPKCQRPGFQWQEDQASYTIDYDMIHNM